MKSFYQECYGCHQITKFNVYSGEYGKFYMCSKCGRKINIFSNPYYTPPVRPKEDDDEIPNL